ncbi:hypothetical protein PYL56_08070 [Staphylococcus succinus]|uniref:hypothetical protein n=1 Tax=Staphylococcus succinus TaxID=61015 RepID=UPI00247FC335|nr:hypothetical protein [Staphylococcus succinus]MDH9161323.1 hypothetical protein [Staphylococcus succinus]
MFERLEVNKMKLFVKIFIAGLIGELCIFLIIYMGEFDFLKQYEKIDVTVGIVGLFTTFLGAYLGAKIAGNESRNLFKQEMKMNDLSRNMDVNLNVLEDIEYVKRKIDFINELNRNSKFLEPSSLRQLQATSKEASYTLESLKNGNINKASVVLYSDIQNFYKEFKNFNYKIQNMIDTDATRDLFKNVKKNEIPMGLIGLWRDLYEESDNYLYFLVDNGREEITKKISVDLIIEKNKSFFEEKKVEIKNLAHKINDSFNNMQYKNREDLIEEYTKLYKD